MDGQNLQDLRILETLSQVQFLQQDILEIQDQVVFEKELETVKVSQEAILLKGLNQQQEDVAMEIRFIQEERDQVEVRIELTREIEKAQKEE